MTKPSVSLHSVLLALLMAAALPSAALHAQSTQPLDGIAAVVDEDVILRSELDRAVSNILAQYANRPGPFAAAESGAPGQERWCWCSSDRRAGPRRPRDDPEGDAAISASRSEQPDPDQCSSSGPDGAVSSPPSAARWR